MLVSSALLLLLPLLASSSPLNTTIEDRAAAADCSCGYILSKYNNAYFPKSLTVSFDKVKTIAQLEQSGFQVNTGWQIGTSAKDGGHAQGSSSNIGFSNGLMNLKVPGGQKGGKDKAISSAEIITANAFGGGVFTMNAQLSNVAGTVQSIFSYTTDDSKYGDEQDIEIRMKSNPFNGIELTNFAPNHSGDSSETSSGFPNDPTTSFNDYTIGWLKGGTKYYYNGKAINSPPKYSSEHSSYILLNNWSSGDDFFTYGPPATDSILKVKSLTFYYQTETLAEKYPAYPSGCSQAKACVV